MGRGLLHDFGVETRWFDPADPDSLIAALCPRARAVLIETPGSLTFEMTDVPRLAQIARAHGLISVIDNTWAGPLGFAPLTHGIDITLMSLSKHVGGHSDGMMGSASAGPDWYRRLRLRAQGLAARFHRRMRVVQLCAEGRHQRRARCADRRAGAVWHRVQLGRG